VIKVLFVCTGNTCRSCMAEVIFNQSCNTDYMLAWSAGVSVFGESTASHNAVEVLKKHLGIDIGGRRAIQLTRNMIEDSYIVLTMTKSICDGLRSQFPDFEDKIFNLKEVISQEGDVKDPFGGNIFNYETTYNELDYSISLLIGRLKEDTGIA